MKMTAGVRNGFWYSIGAASSQMATMFVEALNSEWLEYRGTPGWLIIIITWFVMFELIWLFYHLYGLALLKIRKVKSEEITHFVPLGLGLLYGPMLFGISSWVFPRAGEPSWPTWLLFMIPPVLGYELVLLAIKIKSSGSVHR